MLKILKNLKYSFWSIVVIIIFLIIQSQTDLALPEYTSKIVNIGIQAGGIETAVPEVISGDNLELIKMFDNQNAEEIQKNYKDISSSNLSKEEEKSVKKFLGDNYLEKNQGGAVYVLKNLTKEEKEALEQKISTAVLEVSTIKNEETANKIKEQIIEQTMANLPKQMDEKEKEAHKQQMENMSLSEMIKNMPEEQRSKILEQYNEQLANLSDSMKEQAAKSGVKTIYKDLGVDTDKIQNNYIIFAGLQMLGIALITMISAITIMLLSARVAAKLGKTLREKIFSKVLKFSNKEFTQYSTASLITRSTNDIQQIQQLIAILFRVIVYAPIIAIGGIMKVFTTTNNSLTWIIGAVILAILFIIGTLFAIVMPKFGKLQTLVDKINGVAREILTGLPVIRAFNKEKKEEERFDQANTNLMKTDRFVNRAMSLMMPLMMLIMNTATIVVVWFGGHGIDEGLLQVGDMMAFIQYMMQIVMSFLMISMVSIMLPRASISAKRINEVLETEPSIEDKPSDQIKHLETSKKGLVEFKNVSFRYPDADEEILKDINFIAEPGKTTAIIGSTGSGKSTVVNLIPRFYDVTQGSIWIDGVNIKDVPQKELRDAIGFVPQKGVLFSGTIESNIKYADKNISDDIMKEAAEIAQATEFIETKENKYKDPISQGGTNVSGGQKQRLSIARAIAKNPEIFVFDDSFSALDFKTDSKLREELSKKAKNKTIIIVAQRISTILNADQIIVLEEGKVVGKGTHEELMKNNEVYRQIALSQLSEEELGRGE